MREQPSPCLVHVCVVFVTGALRWVSHGKTIRLPALRCDTARDATPDTLCRRSGRPSRRDPGLFVLLPSHSVDRVGCGVSGNARASPGIGSTTLSLSSARHWIHDPQPFQCTALDPRRSVFPVHGVGSTTLSLPCAQRGLERVRLFTL